MTGIYKITSPTGKVYIGQSRNIKKRFWGYRKLVCKNQTRIFNSLKCYGPDAHSFEIIHELPKDVSREIIDNYEIFYISAYRDTDVELLNLKDGGYRGAHSQETKDKIGAMNKGRITLGFKGMKHSEESKLKTSLKLKGVTKKRIQHNKPRTESHCFNLSVAGRKRKHSPDTKIKISQSKKGCKAWNKGIPRTEETKQKIKDTIKRKKCGN